MTNKLDSFLASATLARAKEQFLRTGLRYIQDGAALFMAYLDQQDAALQDEMAHLRNLIEAGGHYAPQVAELQSERNEIAAMRAEAEAIRRAATGPDSHFLDAAYAQGVVDDRIQPLRRREALLQVHRTRVQGPMVQSRHVTGEDCQGRVEEAIELAVRYLNAVAGDPHAHLGKLWRVLTRSGTHLSIWLCSHEPLEKWKSLFFRIEITRSLDTLDFALESYVPFGFPGDRAQYRMDASNVFERDGWHRVDVASTSWNRANTYSLNGSRTDTAGVSFGINAAVNQGQQNSVTQSDNYSVAHSANFGESETMSWFKSTGDNFSGSPNGSSYGNSHGHGSGGAITRNFGSATTTTDGSGTAVTHGTQSGSSFGAQASRSDSRAETIGYGFQLTDGTTLQMQSYAYGIDFGADAEEHLKQWRNGNPDAAVIYDAVQLNFDHMCRHVIKQLQGMGVGSVPFDPGAFEARLEGMKQFILFEDGPVQHRPSSGPRRLLPSP